MKWLTEDAILLCAHRLGRVAIQPTQKLVTINGRRVLVEPDPQGRSISGCPNAGPTIKPCAATVNVNKGYSTLIRIDGQPICLDTVIGLTDGTPPGTVEYSVNESGQQLIDER